MIRTTEKELGEAYKRALRELMREDPMTPRALGHMWREQHGLHHRSQRKYFWNDTEYWIEFPNDADYTAFMLKYS